MQNYVKILLYNIPAFPTGYVDEKVYAGRLIQTGVAYPVKAITDKPFKTTDDPYISRERLIQVLAYMQFETELFTKETVNIGIIEAAEKVIFEATEGEITRPIEVKIQTIEVTPVEETYNYKVKITFLEIISDTLALYNYLATDKVSTATDAIRLRLQKENITVALDGDIYASGYIFVPQTKELENIEVGDTCTIQTLDYVENINATGEVTNITGGNIVILTDTVSESGNFNITFAKAFDFSIYTKLWYDKKPDNVKPDDIDFEGNVIPLERITFDKYTFRYYLCDEDLNVLLKYFDLSTKTIQGADINLYLIENTKTEIVVNNEGLIDINRVDISINTNRLYETKADEESEISIPVEPPID